VTAVRRAAAVGLIDVVPKDATRIRFSPDLRAVAYYLPESREKDSHLAAWMRVEVDHDGTAKWSDPIGPLVEGLIAVEGAPCWSTAGAAVAIANWSSPEPNVYAIDVAVFDRQGKRKWTSRLGLGISKAHSAGPTWGPRRDDVTLALNVPDTQIWRFCADDEPTQLFKVPRTLINDPKAVWSSDGRTCCVQNDVGVWLRHEDGSIVDLIQNEPDGGPSRYPWTPPQWTGDGKHLVVTNRGASQVFDAETRKSVPLTFEGQSVAAVLFPDETHYLVIGRVVLEEHESLLDAARRGFESVPDRYTYFALVFDREGVVVPPGKLFEHADRGRHLDSRRELGMWTTTDWTFPLLQQFAR
jgi:hypothetical protein